MAITLVQTLPSQLLESAGGGVSQTAPFAANPTLGNYLVCTISRFTGGDLSIAVADSNSSNGRSNVWFEANSFGRAQGGGDFELAAIFWCRVLATGDDLLLTITSGDAHGVLAQCIEVAVDEGEELVPSDSMQTGGQGSPISGLTLTAPDQAAEGELLVAVLAGESDDTVEHVTSPAELNGSASGVTMLALVDDFFTVNGGQHSYSIGGSASDPVVWSWSCDASSVGYAQLAGCCASFKAQAVDFASGINLRSSEPFVTDGATETFYLGDSFPVLRRGLIFGAITGFEPNIRDRDSGVDPRIAGMNFVANGGPAKPFRYYLPFGPGDYELRLAIGDPSNPQEAKVVVYDGDSGGTLITTIAGSTGSGEFLTANGDVRDSTAWVAGYATDALPITFVEPFASFYVGDPDGGGFASCLAHVSLVFVGGGGGGGGLGPMSFYYSLLRH